MRIGKEKHEKILTKTIKQLEDEGYKMIRLDGKSPTCIAMKDNISNAVCILGRHGDKNRKLNGEKTIAFLEDHYHMFDKIDRIHFDNTKENRNAVINKVIKDYEQDGFRIISLAKKSPDAIAIKNNSIFAVEITGVAEGHSPKFRIKEKESIYTMFDGLMVKTFYYDSDAVFTETFGRSINSSIPEKGSGVIT